MKIWITGEESYLAQNFVKYFESEHEVINRIENSYYDYWRCNKEIDIFDPSLKTIISRSDAELIIHNASFSYNNNVQNSIRINIEGTYLISTIAKSLNIPLIYINSSGSKYGKNNYYGYTKKCAKEIMNLTYNNNISIIPGEIYGGLKDDKITQLIKKNNETINLNIDPECKKPFTYIDDFLDGLNLVINNFNKIKNKEIEIGNESKYNLCNLLEYIEKQHMFCSYNLYPEKDYLLEYMLDIQEIKKLGWKPKFDLIRDFDKIKELVV